MRKPDAACRRAAWLATRPDSLAAGGVKAGYLLRIGPPPPPGPRGPPGPPEPPPRPPLTAPAAARVAPLATRVIASVTAQLTVLRAIAWAATSSSSTLRARPATSAASPIHSA